MLLYKNISNKIYNLSQILKDNIRNLLRKDSISYKCLIINLFLFNHRTKIFVKKSSYILIELMKYFYNNNNINNNNNKLNIVKHNLDINLYKFNFFI